MAALLALPVIPSVLLLGLSLFAQGRSFLGGTTLRVRALVNGTVVALVVAIGSLALGLPIGVLNALYDYRGRRLLFTLSMLPLLVPSFLWAFGWRWFLEHLGRWLVPHFFGYTGCVLVFLPAAFALVLFTTVASTAALPASVVEAARTWPEASGRWSGWHAATPRSRPR